MRGHIRVVTAFILCLSTGAHAADHYVSTDGKADATGTKDAPWDIVSALSGVKPVAPGDTVWLRGGTYRYPDRKVGVQGYQLKLKGAKDMPVHVRACPGERVTLDGGLQVVSPATHVWVWDLEIIVSENLTMPRTIDEKGSHPQSLARPWGSLNVRSGDACKYINLVIHDCAQGVGLWRSSTNDEIHGCLIYRNGWIGPDRHHGPAIYTQNQTGTKHITDNLLFGNYSFALQAYGSSRTWVDNYHIVGNVAFSPKTPGRRNTFQVGGGRPSRNIVMKDNVLFGYNMRMGTQRKGNHDGECTGNKILLGRLSKGGWEGLREEDNLVWNDGEPIPWKQYVQLRPNKYDPNRANLAIVNLAGTDRVNVDFGSFLKAGEPYRLQAAWDFYGKPVLTGKYEEDTVSLSIPDNEFTMGRKVSAYIVFRRTQ